jgi:nicotinamidase-related amidase
MAMKNFAEASAPFLNHVQGWYNDLQPAFLDELIGDAPDKVAIFCVDVIVGFCQEGPLSSPRVNAIVAPIAGLFQAAYDRGVRNFVLPQDTHHEQAVEFGQYAPHCIAGTRESETVPELLALPFASEYTILPKNSISSSTIGLGTWMNEHPEVERCIVVGDCTDLCTYQLAMDLRLYANEHQLQRRVVLPENCVNTYDLPINVAEQIGTFAHPGDFYHLVFLFHMAQNGVEIVSELK